MKNRWLADFLSLFYPNYCYACGRKMPKSSRCICPECELHLPRTDYPFRSPNPMEQLFWGRVQVEAAAAYLHFRKGGSVQSIVHALKYGDRPEIGRYFGRLLGEALCAHAVFSQAEALVPIPLHPKKQRVRGYNQSEEIAEGMREAMGLPVWSRVLLRTVATDTQTKRSVYQRWENVQTVFRVASPSEVEGRHLILVDDVVTTGATLEAAAQTLKSVPGVRVSMAALAVDTL
ncbi:MAG: ComF family protein [Bacteroidales bacterium]|nr:ComF family protein [Bacteroidales bacterium]